MLKITPNALLKEYAKANPVPSTPSCCFLSPRDLKKSKASIGVFSEVKDKCKMQNATYQKQIGCSICQTLPCK